MKKKKPNEIIRIWRNYPDYKLLTYSSILTGLASWGAFIAMLVLLNDITDNGIELGTLWAVSGLAPMLFSFILGVIIDRGNPKKIIIYTELIKSVVFLGFIVVPMVEGFLSWGGFVLIRFISGICNQLSTIARQTIIPDLIEKEDLIVANSFNFTITSSIRLLGAATGGTLLTFININYLWVFASMSFLISAIMLIKITYNSSKQFKSNKNIAKEIAVGFKVAKNARFVKYVLIAALTGGLIIGSFNLMIEQMVSNIYKTKAYGISILYIAEGIVSVYFGYWIANHKILFKKRYHYGYIYILMGVSWAFFGFTQNLIQGTVILMLFSFVGAFIVPFERQVMQMDVDPELRGRIFGLWNTCSTISIQIGAFLTGIAIHYVGIHYVPLITSIFEILLGVIFLVTTKNFDKTYKKTIVDF